MYTQGYTGIRRDTQGYNVYAGIHKVYTGIHKDTQVYTGIHEHTQVYTQVYTGAWFVMEIQYMTPVLRARLQNLCNRR